MKILSQEINKVIMSKEEVFVIYHCSEDCHSVLYIRYPFILILEGGGCLRSNTRLLIDNSCFIRRALNDAFCCFDSALLIMSKSCRNQGISPVRPRFSEFNINIDIV